MNDRDHLTDLHGAKGEPEEWIAFNGDADGLCALQQLRLAADPAVARLITGPKREIELLPRVTAKAGDRVTVLDISLDKNRPALLQLLHKGVSVRYFDHHYAGEIPHHRHFTPYIDTAAECCTALLVDRYLGGQYPLWAITAAFGDNLATAAYQRAAALELGAEELGQLQQLGILLNYNGYGDSCADLHFHPAELAARIAPWHDPRDFIANDTAFTTLREGYENDNRAAADLQPTHATTGHALYQLPNQPWARRISGDFANRLARQYPSRAHAILTDKGNAEWLVSVRAPLNQRSGADTLCRRFATGGGRAAAAGINTLAESNLNQFITALGETWP
jgi:hypothetical protein